jgi:prepilin-type N-terminal cleavage/methylation domain-containing protein
MKNKKGFTLVELIVVLAVTTILLGTIISIFLQSISYFKIDETKAANQDSINIVSTSFDQKIRSADSVSGGVSTCTITALSGTEYIYSLDASTHILTLNGAYLTSRIATFSCIVSVDGDSVTLLVSTINDNTGTPQSISSTLNIRK